MKKPPQAEQTYWTPKEDGPLFPVDMARTAPIFVGERLRHLRIMSPRADASVLG